MYVRGRVAAAQNLAQKVLSVQLCVFCVSVEIGFIAVVPLTVEDRSTSKYLMITIREEIT